MVERSDRPELQHYVPQFLLRNFAVPGSSKIYAFDKHTDKVFATNVRNVASERDFYEFSANGKDVSLEPLLVRKFREVVKYMQEKTHERLIKMGKHRKMPVKFQFMSEDDIKQFSASMLLGVPEIASYVADKIWLLFEAEATDPFYISDHPIVLQNNRTFGPYGNLGFAVPGVEIYLPITRTLAIGMLCRSIEKSLRKEYEEQDRIQAELLRAVRSGRVLLSQAASLSATMSPISARVDNFRAGVERGEPIRCDSENVMNLNSLQVLWSHRYVMSASDDFRLVRRMISDSESHRTGLMPRMD